LVLRENLIEAFNVLHNPSSPFLLALGNLPVIPHNRLVPMFREKVKSLQEHFAELEERRLKQQPLPFHVNAMFEFVKALNLAEQAWLDEFVREIENQNGEPRGNI
jgi:hypothetical protein